MAANLSVLAPITTTAAALSNLILVSPQKTIGYQPQNIASSSSAAATAAPQPALLFHYEGEQSVDLESDITDHYIEDNTAIQDQWAIRPEVVNTDGFIGELNDVTPAALQALQIAADKLTTLTAYTPGLSETALIAYQEAFFIYQTGATAAASAISTWNALNGTGGESVINSQGIVIQANQNKQQTMFQQFYGYWRNRTLFTVQTPWAVFQNMAIKSLKAVQDAETNQISTFKVSFKMIRVAATTTSLGATPLLQGRLIAQSSSAVDLGTSTPVSSISTGSGLTSMGVA